MRTKIMIIVSLIIVAVLNYGIYQKEQIKKHGETILLELAPADPRSLMQGDYMDLRYAIERSASKKTDYKTTRGYMVIRPNEKHVAQFVRFYKGEKLAKDEKLIFFRQKNSSFFWIKSSIIHISPDSFFFQEGQAKDYEKAKYGVFKIDDSGKYLLVDLADKNRNIISP